jgi:hypothetical protein
MFYPVSQITGDTKGMSGSKSGEREEVKEVEEEWTMDRLMDQISIKTPNPICRLHWCLIEFVEWRYS